MGDEGALNAGVALFCHDTLSAIIEWKSSAVTASLVARRIAAIQRGLGMRWPVAQSDTAEGLDSMIAANWL